MNTFIEFEVFGSAFVVHYFSVFLLLALIVFLAVQHFELKKRDIDERSTFDNILLVLVLGLIGGRALFVALNLPYYFDNLGEILQIWYGGFYFEGAFIFALIYLVWWLRRENKKRLYGWLDALIVASLPAQVLVKIGVYFSERGMQFQQGTFLGVGDSSLHIIEAVIYFFSYFAALLLFWGFKKEIRDGVFFYAILIMLSVVHLIFTPRFGQISLFSIGDYLIFPSHLLFFVILTGAVIGLIMRTKQLDKN